MQYTINMLLENSIEAPDYFSWIFFILILGILIPYYSFLLIITLLFIGSILIAAGIGLQRSLIFFFGVLFFTFTGGLIRSPEGIPIYTTAPSEPRESSQYFRTVERRVSSSINATFSSPKSEILHAMLLGDTGKIPWETKIALNRSGLRHITAISGMHIATIYILLSLFFVGIGFWRQHALGLATVIMILYILLIGAPPSAVRALIMGIFVVIAEILGRPGNSTRFLMFAAGIMTLLDPQIVWTIGFQLSFSAVFGIIHISPIIKEKLSRFPDKFGVQTLIAVSLSAQLSVFPLLLYYFGETSVVGVLTNIIIVPLLPLLLISSSIAVFAGILNPLLGFIFSLPANILLTILVFFIDISSAQSFATVTSPEFPIFLIISYYLILLLIVFHMKHNKDSS